MRLLRGGSVVSPTIAHDRLEVLVVRQSLDHIHGALPEKSAPKSGDQVDDAKTNDDPRDPEREKLQEAVEVVKRGLDLATHLEVAVDGGILAGELLLHQPDPVVLVLNDGILAVVFVVSNGHDVVGLLQLGPVKLAVRDVIRESPVDKSGPDVANVVNAHVELVALVDEGMAATSGLIMLLKDEDFLADFGQEDAGGEATNPAANNDGIEVIWYL